MLWCEKDIKRHDKRLNIRERRGGRWEKDGERHDKRLKKDVVDGGGVRKI